MTKTRMLPFTCSKCGQRHKIDIGDTAREEVERLLNARTSFECPGHHVEFGSPLRFWSLLWDEIEDQEQETDETFFKKLLDKYGDVYTIEEIQALYPSIQFIYGLLHARSKATGEERVFDWATSPSGRRYYY